MTYSQFVACLQAKRVTVNGESIVDENSLALSTLMRYVPDTRYEPIIRFISSQKPRGGELSPILDDYFAKYSNKLNPYIYKDETGSFHLVLNHNKAICIPSDEYYLFNTSGELKGVSTVLLGDTDVSDLSVEERAFFDFMRLVSCGIKQNIFRDLLYNTNSCLYEFFKLTSEAGAKANLNPEKLLGICSSCTDPYGLLTYNCYRLPVNENSDYALFTIDACGIIFHLPDNVVYVSWENFKNFEHNRRLSLALICYIANINGIQMQWNCCKSFNPKKVMQTVNSEYVRIFDMHKYVKEDM